MLTRLTTALVLCCLAGLPGRAAEEPKAFACTFTNGTTQVYENGAFAPEKATPLVFGIVAIDIQGQTADLKTGSGTGSRSLKIAQAVNATHFLEVVTEGSLHITTVFDKDDAKGSHPAVHSRHFGLLGQPIVSHYHGFCEATG